MNHHAYYCPRCDSILVAHDPARLACHVGSDNELHFLIFCKKVGEFPADWKEWEVKAQARYEIENFGLVRGEVAHG